MLSGGGREVVIYGDRVIKRQLRYFTFDNFDIMDKEDNLFWDQFRSEKIMYELINYMPKDLQNFFPKFYGIQKQTLIKPTFDSEEIENILNISLFKIDLEEIEKVVSENLNKLHPITTEVIAIFERVLNEDEIYEKFNKTEIYINPDLNFVEFALAQGLTKAKIDQLFFWLKELTGKSIYSLDFLNIQSNWGLRVSDNFPVILDLGCFMV